MYFFPLLLCVGKFFFSPEQDKFFFLPFWVNFFFLLCAGQVFFFTFEWVKFLFLFLFFLQKLPAPPPPLKSNGASLKGIAGLVVWYLASGAQSPCIPIRMSCPVCVNVATGADYLLPLLSCIVWCEQYRLC